MRSHRLPARALALAVLLGFGAACGSQPAKPATDKITPTVTPEMSPEEAGGMRAADATTGAAARHLPHGGTPVALGTAGTLEFVLDPSSGLLTAYVLDASNVTTRVAAASVELSVTPPGGQPSPLSLKSTANGLTGDTVGNSSQFGGTLAGLKGVTTFSGVVTRFELAGQTFSNLPFSYPAPAAH